MVTSGREGLKVPLCFVIGPIGKQDSLERKHADLLLHAVIKHTLEGGELGYKVKRADEDADPGMIGDRVISDIIQAELVVADLTDLNPNVLYELGIRHSTQKPTIHVAKAGTLLPFDTVAHRTIFIDLTDWYSIEQGRSRLAQSARVIRSADFQVSNPITQANASFQMRESADPRDRLIAVVGERIGSLETRVEQLRQTGLGDDQARSSAEDVLIEQFIRMKFEEHAKNQTSPANIVEELRKQYPRIIKGMLQDETNMSIQLRSGYIIRIDASTIGNSEINPEPVFNEALPENHLHPENDKPGA
jgi:hypothetical protein